MPIELLNMDCMEYMKTCNDNEFDLAIVDPPYGIGKKAINNNDNKEKLAKCGNHKLYANEKSDRPSREYFAELARVSKNRIIWGANHMLDLFDGAGPGWVVWNKETTAAFSDCELAYTSFDCAAKLVTYRWNGMLQGVHGDKKKNEQRIHPSQKPIFLYNWIYQQFADPGQRVLDTHLGSGSSAIAAHFNNLDFVGCEIDSDYFEATIKRFERETAQMRLDIYAN